MAITILGTDITMGIVIDTFAPTNIGANTTATPINVGTSARATTTTIVIAIASPADTTVVMTVVMTVTMTGGVATATRRPTDQA